MSIIYTDILKYWINCWQKALMAGVLLVGISIQMKPVSSQRKQFMILHFADGVFLYYLLYVTLLSRTISSRREVEFLPFMGDEIRSGDIHYIIENVLLFIPFGFLLYMTFYVYGKKCSIKMILPVSFLVSVSVELLQYIFSCGKSETDDVIANVLGAALGYFFVKLKRR